ncbi:MAG: hypothetical protein R6U95_01550 [Bacteroidales bacterium]
MKKIGVIILIVAVFTACKKEDPVHVTVLQKSAQHTYVYDNLIGNVQVIINNTEHSYSVTVINGPGSVVGCAIRNYNSPSTVYFSDSYIPRGITETQTGAHSGIPARTYLQLHVIVYGSSVSSAMYRSIELLGLDFWDSINSYKEHIADEYSMLFVLEE